MLGTMLTKDKVPFAVLKNSWFMFPRQGMPVVEIGLERFYIVEGKRWKHDKGKRPSFEELQR
ncbi:unnamed protein product [Brassica oleracea var. botrytis]